MPTLSEIRQQVRSHIDEQTSRFWDDPSELDVWIHEAARDVARRGEVLADTHKIVSKASEATYDLPRDLLRIHRVEYWQSSTNGWTLEFAPINQMDDMGLSGWGGAGRPSRYSLWGFSGDSQQLRLGPAPSSAGESIVLFYYRLPHKPEKDQDLVEIPSGWEDLLPLYVESVARRKDNDARWREAFDLYMERLNQMIKTTRHLSDSATMFSHGSNWLESAEWG